MKILDIHLTGVCGIGMGTLAAMLKEKGFNVSGSDADFYPPMSSMLEGLGIPLYIGYSSKNIRKPDLVIIGNSVSRGNPEVEYILNSRVPYISMADALYKFFLEGKEVIAVSGTHGKSTTAALLAHILTEAGEDPSFFIGGYLNNFDSGYRLGNGRYFVIEGDEYDSSFFQKIPKFICYRPSHLIITSLEFDHADIYSSINEIKLWFKRLVNILPSEGILLYSSRYEVLEEVISGSLSRLSSYGTAASDFYFETEKHDESYSYISLRNKKQETLLLKSRIFGEFNCENITAAVSAALLLGINRDSVAGAVESFRGVKRRQEIIYNSRGQVIIEDFAHHPTSIKSVIIAVRERFAGHKIWAIYEPRSATSRRSVLQHLLPGAFKCADRVIIKSPYRIEGINESERLDIKRLLKDMNKNGIKADIFNDVQEIVNTAAGGINPGSKNVYIIMSNGGFDGIYSMMKKEFDTRLSK